MEYNFWDDRTWYDHPCPLTMGNCYNIDDETGYSKCSECEIMAEYEDYLKKENEKCANT
ncbi:MAG: hypothetical protein J6R32_04535 [Bacteroidales bacterium]|nr:hypothetical protein [Bacteroidales bacterium]